MTYDVGTRQARLLELADAEGNLERPLEADEWWSPGSSVALRDGCLVLDRAGFLASHRFVRAGPSMLEQFVRLAEPRSNHEGPLLRYARRWGLLDLCSHQMSMHHGFEWLPISLASTGGAISIFEPTVACRSLFWTEPIETWFYWARQAAALLAVVSHLRRSESARSADWSVLGEVGPWAAHDQNAQGLLDDVKGWTDQLVGGEVPLRIQQDVASRAIETWLRLSGFSPELRWGRGVPEVRFRTGGLLGALGLQILLAAADSSGWLPCPGCGTQRAPARSGFRRRRYCTACRAVNKPQKLASEKWRATKAADPAFREAERARVRDYRQRHGPAAHSSPAHSGAERGVTPAGV